MPAQIFGAPAAAVELYLAFYGAAPPNSIYNNYIGVAGRSGVVNLALIVGNQFSTVPDPALATHVLTNLGITATTIPAPSYTALQTALAQAFAAYPMQRGIVVLNAMNILAQLEADATFGSVAQTFNQAVTNAYVTASDTATLRTDIGIITPLLPLTVNANDVINGTARNDNINGNLFFNSTSGTFLQTLNTGDVVNGGAGTDTLTAGFNNAAAQTIHPTLTSIENLEINATGAAATTLDLSTSTGLAVISISNGRAGGDVTLANLGTLATTLSLNSTDAGIAVNGTAAAIAGTADTVALNLNKAGISVPAPVGLTGYETINIASNGFANAIALTYSAGATVKATGTSSLQLSTGTSTNAILIDGSGMTGAGNLIVVASGGANNVSVTGSANGDTVSFGAYYTSADSYDGGAGSDTITVNQSAAADVTAKQSNLSNLEVLSLADAATAATYTPAAFGGATTLSTATAASASSFTVNYNAGTAGLNIRGDNTGAAITLNASGSATTDVLNLTLGLPNGVGVTVGVAGGILNTNGFETVNLTSSAALGLGNMVASGIQMRATAATEILNITGTRDLTITGTVGADRIDASTFTRNLVMGSASESATFSAGAAVTTSGVQITGGAGNDVLFGSNGADQIVGGAGDDRISFGDTSVAGSASANQGDIATGGAGADQFRFVGNSLANLLAQSAGTAQVVRITDFVAGTDKIGLVNTGGAFTGVTLATAQTIATAADLSAVYGNISAIAASVSGGAASAVVVTVSMGLAAGIYLYVNDATPGVSSTGDMLVNMTGLSGTLNASDFVFV